jgi:hypothetical protein
MNKDNYATLEAAQRLVDAGIVLETDWLWEDSPNSTRLVQSPRIPYSKVKFYPAPSMAEVWRELPESIKDKDFGKCHIGLGKVTGKTVARYVFIDKSGQINTNPTDALIDLLIWVKAQKEVRDVRT